MVVTDCQTASPATEVPEINSEPSRQAVRGTAFYLFITPIKPGLAWARWALVCRSLAVALSSLKYIARGPLFSVVSF